MITYISKPGVGSLQCKVRLDKKIVGAIYQAPCGGFYYRPTGSAPGEIFPTITEVKLDLSEG